MPELMVLLTGLARGLRSVMATLGVLVIIICIFAIVFKEKLGIHLTALGRSTASSFR
jgi:hypothetical protein